MKKLLMIVAACAALTACNQNGKTTANAETTDSIAADSMAADSTRYEGVVPAADGHGIRYELAMANDTTAGFHLTMTYLQAKDGKDEVKNFDGKVENITKTVNGKEIKAFKLDMGKEEGATFLKVENDSTLRLVNDNLEESVNKELNYDLKLKK